MRVVDGLLIIALSYGLVTCAHREVKNPAAEALKLQSTWHHNVEILDCINDQLDLYGDLCAESSSGYEDMDPRDAHFEGVKCAAESIKICMGIKED